MGKILRNKDLGEASVTSLTVLEDSAENGQLAGFRYGLCFVGEVFFLFDFPIYKHTGQSNQCGYDGNQARCFPADISKENPTKNSRHGDDKAQDRSQFLTIYVRINDLFLYGEAVIVLSLGHLDYSFGRCWDDLVVSFEGFGLRQRTRPLAHLGLDNGRASARLGCHATIAVFSTHGE